MKIYLFYHSIISDWNHRNAHFLRGMVSAFQRQGHEVHVYEPSLGWSLRNLLNHHGVGILHEFNQRFPRHFPVFYHMEDFEPEEVLYNADVVIVHEWNDPELVKKLGKYRSLNSHFKLLFHDTHHRAVTKPKEMARFDLQHYDGALVLGQVLKEMYEKEKWVTQVMTWHEAADTTIFQPVSGNEKEGDLVWVGNWGDNERTDELIEYIIDPAEELNLKAVFYGVKYPKYAIRMLEKANIEYRNWMPNHEVPDVFSKFRFTVHIPRRPYVMNLPGIPTIRPFEAMASGIPLICSTWHDTENLFTEGKDYLRADNGMEMKQHMQTLLNHPEVAESLSKHALHTIMHRHTCNFRADEFMEILEKLGENKKQTA